MKVLRAIGGFFARIGKWIRDTAWVQPLLIVGGIFALIFAIKPTVNWVQSWFSSGNAVEKYYKSKKLSWDNAGTETGSKVEHLFEYMMDPDGKYKNEFSEKFFVLFYVDGCEGCIANYDGFNYLETHIGQTEFSEAQLQADLDKRDYDNNDALYESALKASKTLTIYTVDCGELDTRDATETKHKTYFEKYIYGSSKDSSLIGQAFFSYLVEEQEYTTPYLDSIAVEQDGDGNKLLAKKWAFQEETSETTGFYDPTCLLYEKSYRGQKLEYNVSEVMFDFQGETGSGSASDKGRTVWNCWTHNKNFTRYDDKK